MELGPFGVSQSGLQGLWVHLGDSIDHYKSVTLTVYKWTIIDQVCGCTFPLTHHISTQFMGQYSITSASLVQQPRWLYKVFLCYIVAGRTLNLMFGACCT